jgi:hypothetical protein
MLSIKLIVLWYRDIILIIDETMLSLAIYTLRVTLPRSSTCMRTPIPPTPWRSDSTTYAVVDLIVFIPSNLQCVETNRHTRRDRGVSKQQISTL